MKSLTFSCVICALNLYFAQALLRKAKFCSRLLEPQKVGPNAKSCSKVAEHNQERPSPMRSKGTTGTRQIPRPPSPCHQAS